MNQQTQQLMFSSETVEWETPDDLFEERRQLFGLDLDVCATAENAKLPRFITQEQDAFKAPWTIDIFTETTTTDLSPEEYATRSLAQTRPAHCWMNPPYGDPEYPCKKNKAGEYRCKKKICAKRGHHNDVYVPGIYDWVKLAADKRLAGNLTDCLLPSRTDTKWWHEFVWDRSYSRPYPNVLVKFLPGRLKFGGMKTGAPFPSVLVTFFPR